MLTLPTITPLLRRNWRHFTEGSFKCIFSYENVLILIKFALTFIPKCPINNILELVQVMAWHRLGDKPLSEPMIISLTHICVTRRQWISIMACIPSIHIWVLYHCKDGYQCWRIWPIRCWNWIYELKIHVNYLLGFCFITATIMKVVVAAGFGELRNHIFVKGRGQAWILSITPYTTNV